MESVTQYPLIPVRNTVMFPGTVISLVVGRSRSVAALEEAQYKKIPIVVATEKTQSDGDPDPENIYNIGTLCHVESVKGSMAKGYQVIVRGLSRFIMVDIIKTGEFLSATGQFVADAPILDEVKVRGLLNGLKELAQEILSFMVRSDRGIISRSIQEIDDPSYLANLAATYLNISTSQKQSLLEEVNVINRIEILISLLIKERDVLKVQKQIHQKMAVEMTEAQRKALLRQQIDTIKQELGEADKQLSSELEKKIIEANVPPEVQKVVEEELGRLASMSPQSSEFHVIRNYLELLAAMPWDKSTKDEIDMKKAKEILDEDHYGLDDVKKRILEFLAVAKLKNDLRGPILCLLGPPGVGKTSLGQSIARVLGRKFVRASLGGVRDEAEIRGHRRTYVGAMPGRIIQGLKRAGVNNPVFMLDEIDKLGMSYQGDPASSLLEVLDPEQNKSFIDHYLDVPFDLSSVFFITTANMGDTIPAPLYDRMEIINVSGYTRNEKLHISKKYILPKQLAEHGLSSQGIVVTDDALDKVISSYTREAGVRGLQRQIAAICRWSARQIVEGKAPPFNIVADSLYEIMGPEKFIPEVKERTPCPGVATGLAWTPHGGDILFIEASVMDGAGHLILTGQLGEIMKESAQIAMSFVREAASRLNININFEKKNVHIHVPAGAIPKDGPSAGITILTALASLITDHAVEPGLAMTGEITLRGAVLPVGGIKEKVLAAHRAGIEKIILPRRNEKDIIKIPEEVKKGLKLFFVDTVDDVLQLSIGLKPSSRHTSALSMASSE